MRMVGGLSGCLMVGLYSTQELGHIMIWRGRLSMMLVFISVLATALACAQSPAGLNQGRGTRDNPIAARSYAKTTSYEVRAQSVVRPVPDLAPENDVEKEYMKVQFEIKCARDSDEVCDLAVLREQFRLVDEEGIIYESDPTVELPARDDPLECEILGGAAKAGWMAFRVPVGVPVNTALAEYGEDQRIFFRLP